MSEIRRTYQWELRIVTVLYCVGMLFLGDTFQWMALNVFLAYIPIELCYHLKAQEKGPFFVLCLMWLLFYPNAPYLLTDFFHLQELQIYSGANKIFLLVNNDWLSFCLFTLGILIYSFLGMFTVFSVVKQLENRGMLKGISQTTICYFLINFLSSLAIYVGRFDRLHSIHLVTSPLKTLQLIFFQWSINKLIFILLFTVFQSILLLFLNRLRNVDV